MKWVISLIVLNLLMTLGYGVYLECCPMKDGAQVRRTWRRSVPANLAVFMAGFIGALALGMHDALAQQPAVAHGEVTVGMGLALLGAGLPTALAAFAAGLAVASVGAASLAVIAEKPEMFGRTLIYLGLAEGIAIYGLVVTILLLGKIG